MEFKTEINLHRYREGLDHMTEAVAKIDKEAEKNGWNGILKK